MDNSLLFPKHTVVPEYREDYLERCIHGKKETMHINEKRLNIEPPWDSKGQTLFRKDPLEFIEIPFVCKFDEPPFMYANLTYAFCSVNIEAVEGEGGLIWRMELTDGAGEVYHTWHKLMMWDVTLLLPVCYFYDPETHNSKWLERQEIEARKQTWFSIRDERESGWYFALVSRQRKYKDRLGFLPPPAFWNIRFMAWYYRYVQDFHKVENLDFDIDILLDWEDEAIDNIRHI